MVDARQMIPRAAVSVVIPVFNRPAAVRRAVDTVLAQTRQDFEVVVVDDASTDDTPAALAALSDPRITVVRHSERRGGAVARNTGVRASSAPFVAFLDSDDEWLPAKLEKQLDVFARAPEDLGLVYCGVERVYADGSSDISIPTQRDDLARALLTQNVVGETTLGMVRRCALDAIGGFDESLPASQDMDLWLRLSEWFAVASVPEVLARVAKGNDRGRITSSIAATTRGRELFRRKHHEKMVRHGVLHLHLRESGWWYQRGARNLREARRCYLEAVAARPLSPGNYLLVLGTLVPQSWLDVLSRSKQRLTAVARARDVRREVHVPAGYSPTTSKAGRS
jgi:glycosyltransferase involved in cell wall biosynthesis